MTNTTRCAVLAGIDASLPDDPRDCCRAALKLMGDGFNDAEELLDNLLHVIFSALLDDGVDHERVRSLIGRAQDAAATIRATPGRCVG